MRTFSTFSIALLLSFPILGQGSGPVIDTLLFHTFEGILDPADTMLLTPSGGDNHWVNYDQDNKPGLCVSNGSTPKGWYWESDLGFENPNMANNDAFTSCSFLDAQNPQNRNWLITSPVFIPDDTYWLCWRSLSYYGPDFMDGYRVLVSTGSNLPSGFSDTLFSAAQTVDRFQVGSLDLNDYLFSSGYIHANGYTDDDYYFVDFENGEPFFHGKMEPHTASLANYAGKYIYIAFLHDSYDDFQIQVDDILVSNGMSPVRNPDDFAYFNILPNPVRDMAFINWKSDLTQAGRLTILDQNGRIVYEKTFSARAEGQIHLDVQGFEAGVYYCKLQTASSHSTKLLVKI